MSAYREWIVMFIALVFFLVIGYKWLYKWLHSPATLSRVKLGKGGKIKDNDPNVKLLQSKGYTVISGRHIIPFAVELDKEVLEKSANMYIDYIAEKNGKSYIVRYERERKPMEYQANSIRDHLLVYSLLLPGMSGILYINQKEGTIRKVAFHLID